MKDYIEIELENKEKIKAEVVTIFKLENYAYNYIIYKYENHYYIAKYIGEDIINLNTNLTENEMKLSQAILEGVMENETRNQS